MKLQSASLIIAIVTALAATAQGSDVSVHNPASSPIEEHLLEPGSKQQRRLRGSALASKAESNNPEARTLANNSNGNSNSNNNAPVFQWPDKPQGPNVPGTPLCPDRCKYYLFSIRDVCSKCDSNNRSLAQSNNNNAPVYHWPDKPQGPNVPGTPLCPDRCKYYLFSIRDVCSKCDSNNYQQQDKGEPTTAQDNENNNPESRTLAQGNNSNNNNNNAPVYQWPDKPQGPNVPGTPLCPDRCKYYLFSIRDVCSKCD